MGEGTPHMYVLDVFDQVSAEVTLAKVTLSVCPYYYYYYCYYLYYYYYHYYYYY